MNLCKLLLGMVGWRVEISVPDIPKCIICVAPHTSNWDFLLGELAYGSVGRKAGFLMKESWFFFPFGLFFKAIGGIPVPRNRKGSLVETLVDRFNHSERLSLAITPEGTRSRTSNWRHGIIHIALGAHVPIVLGVIDGANKRVIVRDVFEPSGDVENDMRFLKDYYRPYSGIHPEKFSADY